MADVIQAQPSARVRLQKNTGVVLYDQQFAPDPATIAQHVGMALTIDPSDTVTLSLGNIVAARNFLLQSDTKITVKINGQADGLSLVGTNIVWACFSASLTEVEVTNDHTTNTAAIQYVGTD